MKSLDELRALREKMKSQTDNRSVAGSDETVIKVGMATCGIAAGARPVLDALLDEADKRQLHNVSISQTAASACAAWSRSSRCSRTGRNIHTFS